MESTVKQNMNKNFFKKIFNKNSLLVLSFSLAILVNTLFMSHAGMFTVHAADRVQDIYDSEKVVIVIDPGHGGDNEGTQENTVHEKVMTLITATAMYEELCKYDNAEVYMTRTTDKGLTLKQRAQYAASVDADFLFSIHYNASLSHELYGTEVWTSFKEPYFSYGYQFGCIQLQTMKDMGLFLRGVKTRHKDDSATGADDYYGIIRESVELSVPAVIIEHCHVDNVNDAPFCDSEEDFKAFGKADALSVAKYFGLYSTELGVDYRNLESELADVSDDGPKRLAVNDYDKPDICQIEVKDFDSASYSENGDVTVTVSAADYSNIILFYDYSIDGGLTYSERLRWPDSDVLTDTFNDTVDVVIYVPENTAPDIIFRVYNMYDLSIESNTVSLEKRIYETSVASDNVITADSNSLTEADGTALPGTTTFGPGKTESTDKQTSIFIFLIICIIIVVLILVTVIIAQVISDGKRKRRRRHMQYTDDYEDEI
jgi:N-acetylmuramoyl-L-alanine amidase